MATSNKVVWVGRVISILVSLVFLLSGFLKLKGGPELTEGMAHLGLSESLVIPLAILEISCVAIYLIPATAVLGAILLTGYLGGAILTHLRVGDPLISHTLFPIYVGALLWAGLYLRDARVRRLLAAR